ncbi:MAG: hypothetical protein AB7N76_10330 [Planctomycetota bacterium]
MSENDNLSAPLARMALFFLGDTLPRVHSVRDVYAQGQALVERGIPVTPAEASFLRQVTWCMLQILQEDEEEGELHSALARVAALALAIIEDDDFTIPEGYGVGSRANLEALALRLWREGFQLNMSLGAVVGLHDLSFGRAAELEGLEARLPLEGDDGTLLRVLTQARVHLRQGEELLARNPDPARAAAHRLRLERAFERTRFLLARLITVPHARDHAVVRAHFVRRELKHIEIDALGAQRITEAEQRAQAKRLLAWTEEDLGEELTDANKAALAARLAEAAGGEQDGEGEAWLFEME